MYVSLQLGRQKQDHLLSKQSIFRVVVRSRKQAWIRKLPWRPQPQAGIVRIAKPYPDNEYDQQVTTRSYQQTRCEA
jgi:hypothetical protein